MKYLLIGLLFLSFATQAEFKELSTTFNEDDCTMTIKAINEHNVSYKSLEVDLGCTEEEAVEDDNDVVVIDDPIIEEEEEEDHTTHMEAQKIAYTNGTSRSSEYKVGRIVGRSGHGNRIFCVVSHLSYDDPILYPGDPGAAHLHMFFGNTTTDAYSTPESLPFMGNSSCEGGTKYRSGVWIPALFNAQDEVVVPDEIFVYYKKFGNNNMNFNHLQEIPQGIEMLASEDTTNFSKYKIRIKPNDSKDGGKTYKLDISFPSCVATTNGKRTGTPILSYRDMPGTDANGDPLNEIVNSHVAYQGGANTNSVNCPVTHPYGFVTPSAILMFDPKAVGSDPYVASDKMEGAPNMSTLHADYIFGMDEEVNKQMLLCAKESRNCRFLFSGDDALAERFKGVNGEVLYRSSDLLDHVDRTPFGKLAPFKETHQGH